MLCIADKPDAQERRHRQTLCRKAAARCGDHILVIYDSAHYCGKRFGTLLRKNKKDLHASERSDIRGVQVFAFNMSGGAVLL